MFLICRLLVAAVLGSACFAPVAAAYESTLSRYARDRAREQDGGRWRVLAYSAERLCSFDRSIGSQCARRAIAKITECKSNPDSESCLNITILNRVCEGVSDSAGRASCYTDKRRGAVHYAEKIERASGVKDPSGIDELTKLHNEKALRRLGDKISGDREGDVEVTVITLRRQRDLYDRGSAIATDETLGDGDDGHTGESPNPIGERPREETAPSVE